MQSDPRAQVRAWLPHVLTVGALVAAVALLFRVATPLFEPILLAAAVAILTAPVLCEPIGARVVRMAPNLAPDLRAKITGFAATVALLLIVASPLVLFVVSQADDLSSLIDTATGLLTRDEHAIDAVVDAVVTQLQAIATQYPNLGVQPEALGAEVRSFLAESKDVNSAFLNFIRAGTGTVAQVALALVSLVYFYIDGERLATGLLSYSPLTGHQQRRLLAAHRGVVLKLLNDTVVTALVKGLVLGTLVWVVDHTLGGGSLPFLPVATVAALITLLPLVGVTMVWLPLAGLAWSRGDVLAAVVLAVTCWTSNLLIDRYRGRIGRRLHEDSTWSAFLLFIGIVGGLLTYGAQGLIIGPFAVVMVITVGQAWLPLYVEDAEDDDDGLAAAEG